MSIFLAGVIHPRKRRTREHVIADQSVNHVERIVIDEGHIARRTQYDSGYDFEVVTCDPDGYVEPGLFYIQIKAAAELKAKWYEFRLRSRHSRL